jgi:hypothetical protein
MTTLSESRTITREDVEEPGIDEAVAEPPRELSRRAKAEKAKSKEASEYHVLSIQHETHLDCRSWKEKSERGKGSACCCQLDALYATCIC